MSSPAGAGGLVEPGEDGRMHLLVEARHAREDRGPDFGQRIGDGIGIGAEGDRVAGHRRQQMREAAEVVRERQIEQQQVVLPEDVGHVVDDLRHLVVVAVEDLAALRRPGRARRVDEGEEVVLADLGLGSCESVGVLARVLPAAGGQLLEVGERQDMVQGRQPAAHRLDLLQLLVVLDEHTDGVGVAQHVPAVLRRRVRVDRSRHAADQREREVEEAPLDPRPAENPERVALADAEREQAVGQLVHPSGRLCERHGHPLAVALREVERIGTAGGHGVPPEPHDRALPCVHDGNVAGIGDVGKKNGHPLLDF